MNSMQKKKTIALAIGVSAFLNLAPLTSRAQESLISTERSDMECAALTTVAGLIAIYGMAYGANKMLTKKTPTWPRHHRRVK